MPIMMSHGLQGYWFLIFNERGTWLRRLFYIPRYVNTYPTPKFSKRMVLSIRNPTTRVMAKLGVTYIN